MRNLKCLLGLAAAMLLSVAPLSAQSYTTADSPVAIPDATSVFACQSINVPSVPGGNIIGTVNITTSVTHTFVGDLTFELRNPGNTIPLTLLHRPADPGLPGGNAPNLANTRSILYDDVASRSAETEGEDPPGTQCNSFTTVGVNCGPAFYHPDPDPSSGPTPGLGTNLAQYTGTLAPGTWQLCVADSASADTGTLSSWSLNFSGNTPVELQKLEIE